MTPEEARTKLCRIAGADVPCVADKCMFWSYDRKEQRTESVAATLVGTALAPPAGSGWIQVESPVHYPGDGEPAQWRQWYKRVVDALTGQCDLKRMS